MKTAAVLLAAISCVSAYGNYNYMRFPRASAGAYSGVSNGQFYGGTYQTPDNGPTLFNRFGDHPPSSGPGAGGNFGPQQSFGPPFQNPLEFNNFFQSYFNQLNNNLAFSNRHGFPHHSSSSHSSFSFVDPFYQGAFAKNFQDQQAAFQAAQKAFQAAAANQFGPGFPYNDFNFNGNGNGGFNGGAAAAGASFGSGGGHQTAGIFPPNPASPNINNRFGGDGPVPGGSFGVSTSSFSGTADVNGKKTSIKQATTSINDNGKVTTYTVRN